MRKKITAVVLAICIAVTSVLSNINVMPVQAASSLTLDLELQAEMLMALLSFLQSCMISAGAKEGFDTYESAKSLLDSFNSYLYEVSNPYLDTGYTEGIRYQLPDGTILTCVGDQITVQTIDGTTETYSNYNWGSVAEELEEDFDTLMRQKFTLLNGGGSGDSGDSGGDEDPEKPFGKIDALAIGTGLAAAAVGFIKALWNGEVEGVDKEDYYFASEDIFEEMYFDGTLPRDSSGNYIVEGNVRIISDSNVSVLKFYRTLSDPVAIYKATYSTGQIQCWFYYLYNGGLSQAKINYTEYLYNNDNVTQSSNMTSAFGGFNCEYYFKIPVFDSTSDLLNYLTAVKNGESVSAEGLGNGVPYDFPDLAEAIAERLAPMIGINFDPNQMPVINTALADATGAISPDPAADPAANNEAYAQAVTDALADVAIDPIPEAGTGTDGGDGDSTDDTDEDGKKSTDFKDFINAFLILFYILFALLQIFLHCLEFIINIFKIPATTGYLPEDMVSALDYLKELKVGPLSISVYDFMLGLIYILIMFFFIGVLRKNIDKIKIPKRGS